MHLLGIFFIIISRLSIICLVFYHKSIVAHNLPDFSNETKLIIASNQEKIMGQRLLHRLRKAGYLAQEPMINAYLNHLGNSLLIQDGQSINLAALNIVVLSGQEINAFAFWGDNIGVFKGFIEATATESELAAILAHEISHLTQKHLTKQSLYQQQLAPITLIGTVAAVATGVPDLLMPILGMHLHQTLAFSRENEQEADRLAIKLLNNSRFDPRSMLDLFNRLNKKEYYGHQATNNIPEYFLTHPMFKTRILDLTNRIAKVTYRQCPDSMDYLLIKAKLKVQHNAQTHSNYLQKNRLMTIEKILKQHKYSNYAALKYEQALILQNLGNNVKAKTILEQLAKIYPEKLIIQLSLVELLAASNLNDAQQRLAYLMAIFPDSLPVIINYAEILVKLRNHSKAVTLLEKYNKNKLYELVEEPKIYELLINCYQQLNKPVDDLFTQAKLLIINDDLLMAKEKLNQAMALVKDQPYAINKITKFYTALEEFSKLSSPY